MTPIFLFPGQNSRYPGMIGKFAALHPDNAELLDRASGVLHRDLRTHFRAGNERQFERNRDVQVAVFLSSHMLLRSLQREGIDADWSLGLSLGEYNHLVHTGALSFENALELLEARGDAYDTSPEGAMASLSPVSAEELGAIVGRLGLSASVSVALQNTPGQQVLSGAPGALAAVLAAAEDELFLQPVFIDRRLAMHSPLFDAVAERFRPALEAVPWNRISRPYLPNALGEFVRDPRPAEFVSLLARHVHCPVLWRKSVELAALAVPDPAFLEVGPRAVLTNMLGRRWLKCPRYAADSEENFPGHFQALVKELKSGQRNSPEPDPDRPARPAVGAGPVYAAG